MFPLYSLKTVGSSDCSCSPVSKIFVLLVVVGDDAAMDTSPAPDPAELHYVELDRLPLDNWQNAFEKMGIKLVNTATARVLHLVHTHGRRVVFVQRRTSVRLSLILVVSASHCCGIQPTRSQSIMAIKFVLGGERR